MSCLDVFVMPKQVSITARSSSITNSFVNGIIPCVSPTEEEVAAALSVLGMDEHSVACAYCGDPFTEWDHLNPLVKDKRPTGYVSEIHNLVPSCGKCNQSKGNKPWFEWMVSNADKSPRTRGIPDLRERVERLMEYERLFKPIKLDFESIVGSEKWNEHWNNCETLHGMMREYQVLSDEIKQIIADSVAHPASDATGDSAKAVMDTVGNQTHKEPTNSDPGISMETPYDTQVPTWLPSGLIGVDSRPNKQFVLRCLTYLESHSSDKQRDLSVLLSSALCKKEFNHDFPVLKQRVASGMPTPEERMVNGYYRYYQDALMLWGDSYLVSKEWYGQGTTDRDNRTPFLNWVVSHCKES